MNRPTAIRVSAGTAEPAVEDDESEPYVPDAENLVAEAVILAAAKDADPELVRRATGASCPTRSWPAHPGGLDGRGHPVPPELAQQRLPGELKLRRSAVPAGAAPSLEVVTDDMPFLVDSVTAALIAAQASTSTCWCTRWWCVRREAAGRAGRGPRRRRARRRRPRRHGRELDAHRGRPAARRRGAGRAAQRPAAGARRRAGGGRGLAADAHAGARAWPTSWPRRSCRCRTRTSPTRSSCCAGWPTTTSRSSATASTGWCGDDGEDCCRRCSAPAWASCARDQAGRPGAVVDDAPRRTRKALEKRLLIITKANSRSTVHRSAYLDYIGVQDVRRRRQRGRRAALPRPVLARRPTAPACATCRWSSARWPRWSSAPG